MRAVGGVTVVSGDARGDSISISDSMRVDRITAAVDVNGNAGSDGLTIDNSADPAQNSFTVSSPASALRRSTSCSAPVAA